MEKLTGIPGIGKASQELLEVAGFLDLKTLAKASVDELVGELERANGILKIAKRTPRKAAVQKWVEAAREMTGTTIEEKREPTRMPVNYEGNPEVAVMLESSPRAIPLPARVMQDNNLKVAEIPAGILLNRYSGDLEVRVADRASAENAAATVPSAAAGPAATATESVQRLERETRLDIDTSRVKTFEEFAERPAPRVQIGSSHTENDRVALLRAPLEETNRGRDPQSRWYIRGVLYPDPFSMALGAVVTLLIFADLPLAIASAALLLLSDMFPASLPWIPKWILVFPLSLPLLGALYLAFGISAKCRICTQRLFWPRNCRKNSKAHHVRGLGHIIPLIFQMLIFRWFRCTYCGTPVRLKK